jgi:Flp pilus assembly protein TadB
MSSISGMITSLKNNKRTRVSTFEKLKNFKEGKNIQVSFDKKATPHQLKRIKEKLQEENKKSLKRNVIILIVAICILIYVIGFVKF